MRSIWENNLKFKMENSRLVLLLIVVLNLSLISWASSANISCGMENTQAKTRIIGGEVAHMNQFPWLVFITLDEKYACTGSLISDRWVLTAAHCTYDTVKFNLYFGIQDYMDSNEPHRVKMTSFERRTHPGYSKKSRHQYDIGLIQLPKPIEFNQYISPICLPTYADQVNRFVGASVMIAGWGRTSDNNGDNTLLHYARGVKVISNKDCYDDWPYHVTMYDSFMCIKSDHHNHKTTCQGDSGSPINYAEKPGGPYKAIGVTSFHVGATCVGRYPHASTRVTSYLEWIESSTGISISP